MDQGFGPSGRGGRDSEPSPWLGALLGRVAGLLLAIPVSMLPAVWRKRLSFHERLPLITGTILSALLQLLFLVWLAWLLYVQYAPSTPDASWAPAGTVHENRNWLILTGVYCLFEACLRLLCVFAVREPLGSLPFWLLERVIRIAKRVRALRKDDQLVIDRVLHDSDGTVTIETCRRRVWDALTVIAIEGKHYRVRDVLEFSEGPRRFLYRMEPLPVAQRGFHVHHYRPDELGGQADALPEARLRQRR